METINVKPGTVEWLKERCLNFTASEAPVMMSASKKSSRDELLAEKATGVPGEISYFTQRLFDQGHEAEAEARPLIESMINEELFPVVGKVITDDGLSVLASFDGLTMMGDIVFEHKIWNESLAESIRCNDISDEYAYQLEQQLFVSGAEKALFVCSDGTPAKMVYMWYFSKPEKRKALLDGWRQFKIDLDNFELPEKPQAKPQAEQIEGLPTLFIDITGQVNNTNIAVVESSVIEFIRSIKTDLQTDKDFVDAEQQIKFCKKSEEQMTLVKKQALSKTADIEKLFNTVDNISAELRLKRLQLEKLVKTQKQAVKQEYVIKTKKAYESFVDSLNQLLGDNYILPVFDFRTSGKNKRTLESFQSALNDDLAKAKIEASSIMELVKQNLSFINVHTKYMMLFPDMRQIVLKQHDDFKAFVMSRINLHEAEEKARKDAEREKIRKEEERKARGKIEKEQAEEAKKMREAAKKTRIEREKKLREINVPENGIKRQEFEASEIHEIISNQKEINDGSIIELKKFRASVEFAGYCRGTALIEVEAVNKEDALSLIHNGECEEVKRVIVRDDTEKQLDYVKIDDIKEFIPESEG